MIDKYIYIPVLTTFSEPYNTDYNMSFGYIKTIKSEYDEIIQEYSDDYLININAENTNKLLKYYIFNGIVETNTDETVVMLFDDLRDMKESFEDNFIIPFEKNNEVTYYRDLSLITE
jgi:hypothetical protein